MKNSGKCAAVAALTIFAPAIYAETFEVLSPPDAVFAYATVIRDTTVAGTLFTTDNVSLGFIFSPTDGYTSFAIPGATPDNGPQPTAIDGAGNVYGYFYDPDGGTRSFVRHTNGAVEAFSVDQPDVQFTQVSDGNRRGASVGMFSTDRTSGFLQGFKRSAAGVVRPLSYPGATYLLPWSINNHGEIAGAIGSEGPFPDRAFIRLETGEWRFFRGANGCAIGSLTLYLNNARSVAGTCVVPPIVQRGYLRLKGGPTIVFSAPGATFTTTVAGIAENNDVAGNFQDASGDHGFIRRASGAFVIVDGPDSQPGTTHITGISPQGDVVGTSSNSGGMSVFVRYED